MSIAAEGLLAVDVDSHEGVPTYMWDEVFGPETRPLLELMFAKYRAAIAEGEDDADLWHEEVVPDDLAITEHTVWNEKGARAPGSFDMNRRADVLRVMGVERQLLFPNMAATAWSVMYDP